MDATTPQDSAGDSPAGQSPPARRHKAVTSWITGATIGLLVALSVVVWSRQEPPTIVARQYLSKMGVATDNLDLAGYETSSPLFPGFMEKATVTFHVKGMDPQKKQVVQLFRIVYFLPWQGTAFREQ